MIWLKEFNDVLLLLWSYMFIYNVSLFIIFSTILQLLSSKIKTLYAFSDLGATNTFTKILIVALFSMAGVPPFWGFFSKIFIFLLLFNSNLFIFYSFFFVLLFTGLYFYVQNIRFLNQTSSADSIFISELNLRRVPLFFYLTFIGVFFIIFGFFYTEDLFLIINWILK